MKPCGRNWTALLAARLSPLSHWKSETNMSAITIKDLPPDVELDRKAMASIYGGDGAPWVFGAFQPFIGYSGPS